jgi:ribonuclease HI
VIEGLRCGSGHCNLLPSSLDHRLEPSRNNATAVGHEPALRQKFMKAVEEGTMAGPYKRPPWPNRFNPTVQATVSPTGTARKNAKWANIAKQIPRIAELLKDHPDVLKLGKLRPTFDASFPYEVLLAAFGVNARQRGSRIQMTYTSAETLATLLILGGPGAVLFGFDVKSAYNTLLLRLGDLPAFVVKTITKLRGKVVTEYFTHVVHPFGTQDAPDEWQAFGHVLLWTLLTHPNREFPQLWAHYVDNFWAVARLDQSRAIHVRELLRAHLRSLRVPFHEEQFGTSVEAIGWIFSSLPVPCMAFKKGKLLLACALCSWLQETSALEEKILHAVVGFFSWVSRPLPILRPFLAEAQFLLKKLSPQRRSVRPTARLKQGVNVAHEVLRGLSPGHRFALHRGHEASATPNAFLRSDASGVLGKGAGATLVAEERSLVLAYSHIWTREEHSTAMRLEGVSSTHLEILALLHALESFKARVGDKFGAMLVEVELDSDAAVNTIRAGYSRVPSTNEVVKQLLVFLAEHNIDIRIRHVLRDENSTADALSKQDFQVRTCCSPCVVSTSYCSARLACVCLGVVLSVRRPVCGRRDRRGWASILSRPRPLLPPPLPSLRPYLRQSPSSLSFSFADPPRDEAARGRVRPRASSRSQSRSRPSRAAQQQAAGPMLPGPLAEEVARVEKAALTKRTKSGYASQVSGVNGYDPVLGALGFTEQQRWPATSRSIEAWLGWLSLAGIKSSRSYLSGLRDAHVARDLPFMARPEQQDKLARLRLGAKHVAQAASASSSSAHSRRSRAVFPVAPLHIRLMAEKLPLRESKEGRLFLAVSAVMSYNANRGGEVFPAKDPVASSKRTPRATSDLLVSSVSMDDPRSGINGMTIVFPPMKTDKLSPVHVWLPLLPGDATCPVSLVRAHLADRGAPKGSEPLFQLPQGQPLTRAWVLKRTRKALNQLGIAIPPGARLSSKSWRAGTAQAVSALPSDIEERIKAAGRWKTRAFRFYLQKKSSHVAIALAQATTEQSRALEESGTSTVQSLPDQPSSSASSASSSETDSQKEEALAAVAEIVRKEEEEKARAGKNLRPRPQRLSRDAFARKTIKY